MFHRIRTVEPLGEYQLAVTFYDGTTKYYDMSPIIFRNPAFSLLKNEAFFKAVQVDAGGYGLCWNDDIDLDCEELWVAGTLTKQCVTHQQ